MLGLVAPTSGEVQTLGQAPGVAVRSGRIGAVLQSGRMPAGVTVGELIDFARQLYARPLRRDEILRRSGLGELQHRRTERLSGGETQRLRFALAIAGDPELLFLDEPTVSMDVESRVRFWQALDMERDRRTVLFATHYLEEADQYAQRVVVLQKGRIVADSTPQALRSGARMIKFRLSGVSEAVLRALPRVTEVQIAGERVNLLTDDPDETVRAVYGQGLPIRDLEVGALALEAAFLDLVRAD